MSSYPKMMNFTDMLNALTHLKLADVANILKILIRILKKNKMSNCSVVETDIA